MSIEESLEQGDPIFVVIPETVAVRAEPGVESIGSVKDDGPSWLGLHGIITLGQGLPVVSADMTTAAAITDTPPGNKTIIITDLIISSAAAVTMQIQEETSTNIIAGPFNMAANSTLQLTPRGSAWRSLIAGKRIFGKAGGAGSVTFDVHYRLANLGDK